MPHDQELARPLALQVLQRVVHPLLVLVAVHQEEQDIRACDRRQRGAVRPALDRLRQPGRKIIALLARVMLVDQQRFAIAPGALQLRPVEITG
jgi:hypothetical protein